MFNHIIGTTIATWAVFIPALLLELRKDDSMSIREKLWFGAIGILVSLPWTAALSIVVIQCGSWLKYGAWFPISVRLAFSHYGVQPPSTNFAGAQKIADSLLNMPLSFVFFMLPIVFVFFGVTLYWVHENGKTKCDSTSAMEKDTK